MSETGLDGIDRSNSAAGNDPCGLKSECAAISIPAILFVRIFGMSIAEVPPTTQGV